PFVAGPRAAIFYRGADGPPIVAKRLRPLAGLFSEEKLLNSQKSAAGVRPLEGLTVVSLEHAIAAPFCTRQLADQGARVIKIERPDGGDFARGYDERVRG